MKKFLKSPSRQFFASWPAGRWIAAVFLAVRGWSVAADSKPEGIRFDRDIRPIFSENCYRCHGPDERARKAKLRLDTKEGAFRLLDGKAVIAPGKSTASELIRRITSQDPEEVMPPPQTNRKLTPQQIDLLRRWIDGGAVWTGHWAFEPIKKPSLPLVKDRKWAFDEIDRFVLAKLEREQLHPGPEATRERWLRRVTFDLTGLPPTPRELESFLGDKAKDAFAKVVDRLLASPRYGERLAVEWLDVARYADTYGYQMDAARPVWPYRDWVIKAFNENLPFDRFATWQLAGDLLPGATRDQRLATAFNRLHMQNEEGGIVPEEYRVAYVEDRVDTFGTAFLGLTLQCTHCHDHKFDPLTMKDYYSLFSLFQNIDEAGQNPYTGFVQTVPTPALLLADPLTEARLTELENRIRESEKRWPDFRTSAYDAFANWLSNRSVPFAIPGLVASFSFDEMKDGTITNAVDGAKNGRAHETPKLVAGRQGQAAEFDGESGFGFPGIGHFTRTDAFTIGLWVQPSVLTDRQVVLHHTKAPADAGSRGYEILLENGLVAVGIHHQWPGASLKIRSQHPLPTNAWTHVAFSYDGSSHAAGLQLFINGRSEPVELVRDHLYKDITYGDEPELEIGFRFRDAGFKGGKIDELRIYDRALTRLEVADLAGGSELAEAWKCAPARLSAAQREGMLDYYLANVYPPARQFLSQLAGLRREQNRLVNGVPEIMTMEEMARPKPAFVLKRGAYDAHGDEVWGGTPAALPPLPAGAPTNRLGLARWLTSPTNPLFARVTVNRAWQMMFGRGIVLTSDDFGAQGSQPTHLELLDALAADFMTSGWDYKGLLRRIALSATYRQSSEASAELLAKDPENLLLGRGPARRLTAEMLRDQALATSGLLVEKVGGPSVKPYQPPGLWEIAMGNPRYDQGHGEDLYRRSLYTFWKRTVPPPEMMTFDASERSVCRVRRQSTSTPLQALGLLNDVQFVEAARFVSERMLLEGGATEQDRLAWAFRLVTSRRPTTTELAVLGKLWREQLDLFVADPQAAATLLAMGEASNHPGLFPADLAAGTVLAEALFNHDEALMRR